MKLFVGLLHVISILAFAASVLGDVADGECPFVQGKTLLDLVGESADKCLVKVGHLDLELLKEIGSHYLAKPEFEEYCQRHELIKTCISTMISAKSSACSDSTQRAALVFLQEVLNTGVSYSCVGGGELFASISFGVFYEENSTAEKNIVTDCFATAKSTRAEGNTPNLSTRVLGLYREIKVFKKCLTNTIRGLNRAIFGAELMLNGILRSMNCPHAEDGATVLCETLDAAPSTDDNACIIEGKDPSASPRFLELVNYATECVTVNVNHIQFDHLKNFTTIAEYRFFFNTYCQNLPRVRDCFGDVLTNSKVCQNHTDHEVLKTAVNFMGYSLEAGCKEDGANAAIMMSGIFNREERAVSEHKLQECVSDSQAIARNETKSSYPPSSKILMVYRVLGYLSKCTLDEASTEGSFKTVFATFTSDVLGAAKCVNPDDETVVACETLVHENN